MSWTSAASGWPGPSCGSGGGSLGLRLRERIAGPRRFPFAWERRPVHTPWSAAWRASGRFFVGLRSCPASVGLVVLQVAPNGVLVFENSTVQGSPTPWPSGPWDGDHVGFVRHPSG